MKHVPNQPITLPKLLLGEGTDECLFFSALLDAMNITDVQVDSYGGKNTINDPRRGLPALLGRSGFSRVVSIGLTRDTDFSADPATAEPSAFASLQHALNAVHLPVPTQIGVPASGQFQGRELRMNVFLLPGGGAEGMLEGLCFESAINDPAHSCVDDFLACAKSRGGRTHAANTLPKARIHAWLSTFAEPDIRLGEAAQKGFIDFNSPVFDPLKAFLVSL